MVWEGAAAGCSCRDIIRDRVPRGCGRSSGMGAKGLGMDH